MYDDGRLEVGEYAKQEIGDSARGITGQVAPENVAELMALVDLLPQNTKLPGGSHKDVHSRHTTYFINRTDLQTEGETS